MNAPADVERFTTFYREHYPQVVAYVSRRSTHDPEAVAADVFAVAWAKHDVSLALGLRWLYRTAHLELMNRRRTQTRATRALAARPPSTMDGQTDDLTEHMWLRSLLAQLPGGDQELLKLLYWKTLTTRRLPSCWVAGRGRSRSACTAPGTASNSSSRPSRRTSASRLHRLLTTNSQERTNHELTTRKCPRRVEPGRH